MDICDKIMDLRITLASCCDGFSVKESSKNLLFSNKTKVLYLLDKKDSMPTELIATIGIAKSNLANLLKSMMEDGTIESYRNEGNTRNVFYCITDKGREELHSYKTTLGGEFVANCPCDYNTLGEQICDLLTILKGEGHDKNI